MTRILISSRFFYPSVGGSETNAEILAREFVALGREVKVVTQTRGSDLGADGSKFPFEVIRRPDSLKHLELVRWCDVYLHNGISLRDAWPLAIVSRPWVVRHQAQHLYVSDDATERSISKKAKSLIKRKLVRKAVSISVSNAIAEGLNQPSHIILNPYRDHLFRVITGSARTRELVFLGRLVSQKGVGLLIEAAAALNARGISPKITIIGSGPEEPNLRRLASDLGLARDVDFVGPKTGDELVQILNRHQIMVVPSLYDGSFEAFGVVALEGIACGCVVVASDGGGLPESIGPCGLTFPNGSREALTEILADLLTNTHKLPVYREKAHSHLQRHKPRAVAEAYLNVIEQAIRKEGMRDEG